MKKLLLATLLVQLVLIGALLAGGGDALAQSSDPHCPEGSEDGTVCLENPLGFIGVNDPTELVLKGFQGFVMLMGFIAVAFTVFSGFKFMVASNEEQINVAKAGITWAVGGFVISLLAFTIISGTAHFIGFEPRLVDLAGDTIQSPLNIPTPRDFIGVMNYIMVNILGLIGFAGTLMFIYYGYRYMTAAGNEEAVTAAKSGMKWTLAGLVIVILAFTIITIVRQLLVF